jgi:hypothetical protein
LNNLRASLIFIAIILLSIFALVGAFLVNYRYVAQDHGDERFLSYWAGTRALLMDGLSPYSSAVARRIEFLGVRSGNSEERVSYPLYAGFIFLPFAAIPDYILARALWMTMLEVALFLIGLLSLNITGWRTSPGLLSLYLLFILTCYPGLRLVADGNTSILVALFVAAAFLAIRSERDELAGAFLALATIQPLTAAILILFILLWAISCRRWVLLTWFFGFLAFISVIGMFLIADWPLQWLRIVLHNPLYPAPATARAAFIAWWPGVGRQIGWAFTGILFLSLLGEWWGALRKEFRWFLWTASLTVVVGQWIGIPSGPENFVVLFFPLVTILTALEDRGGRRARWLIAFILMVLWAGLWALYFRTPESQLRPALFFLLPLILLVLLYWVRWWAIHSPRLFMDEIRSQDQ